MNLISELWILTLTTQLSREKQPTQSKQKVKPEIIEPQGLDLPTTNYDSAADAINLDFYPEEIQPFIKDIFTDKYPKVVALHAIDAGDLPLTLGLTQLR